MSKDLSFGSFINVNEQMSVLSIGDKKALSNKYSDLCSFHNEGVCISFDDLSYFLELYGKTG